MQTDRPFPEFAFLYAVPLDSNLLKSLLLFFDGAAIVASPQRISQALNAEPWFFLPFLQSELSKVWTPDDFFDSEFRESYRTEVRALLSSGRFDNRPINLQMDQYLFPSQFAGIPPDFEAMTMANELARVRDGLIGPGISDLDASTVSENLLDELKRRGLLEVRQHVPMTGFRPGDPSCIGVTETGSNTFGSHVLLLDTTFSQINDALVSQFARTRAAHRYGIDLSPVNAGESSLNQLLEIWRDSQNQVTIGRVIQQDLEVVGPAMENLSLDELLQFREKHGQAHREYMRALRRYVRDMSQVGVQEQENDLYDRRQELTERARALSRLSGSTIKTGARFLMGITGSVISAVAGNIAGGFVSGVAAFLGLGGDKNKGDALTYVCHIAKL